MNSVTPALALISNYSIVQGGLGPVRIDLPPVQDHFEAGLQVERDYLLVQLPLHHRELLIEVFGENNEKIIEYASDLVEIEQTRVKVYSVFKHIKDPVQRRKDLKRSFHKLYKAELDCLTEIEHYRFNK